MGAIEAADSSAPRHRKPCEAQDPVITPAGIGRLSTKQTVHDVLATCPSAVLGWEMGDEAIPEPAAEMLLGRTLVEVVFNDTLPASRVNRLVVADSTARFLDGPKPGDPLQAFLAKFGSVSVEDRECAYYATLAGLPGVELRLETPRDVDCERAAAFADSITRGNVRDGITVSRITVFTPSA